MRMSLAMIAGVAALLSSGMADPSPALDWGPEVNLSGTPTDSETGLGHRALARTDDGSLHVVWAERDGPNDTYQIRTRRLESGQWTPGETIVHYLATDPGEPGDDIGAKFPALAAVPGGELCLFWHDYRIGGIDNVEIFTKARPPGGPWDASRAADIRLTTTSHPEADGDNGYVPTTVTASDGTVHVLWYDYRFDGWHAEILGKTRLPGEAWDLTPGDSADVRVTNDAGHSELVVAGIDASGAVHAAWRNVEAGAQILYARRDPSTSAWSAPETVDLAGTVQGAPALAVDAAGAVHIVWPDGRDGGRALWTRVRNPGGTWSVESRITRPEEGADEPTLTTGTTGVLHLVWSDGRVSLFNREIFHREKNPTSPWDTTGASDMQVSEASGTSSRPSVLVRDGHVSVIWKDARDGQHEIYFRGGGPPGTPVPDPSSATAMDGWRVRPNPARSGPVIITGPESSPRHRLVVHDAAGRRLRVLRGEAERTTWDLRDSHGLPVATGIYFVRAPGADRALRVTVIR